MIKNLWNKIFSSPDISTPRIEIEMKMLRAALDLTTQKVQETFTKLYAVNDPNIPICNTIMRARYNLGEYENYWGVSLQNEVLAALSQELNAEILYDLYTGLKSDATAYASYSMKDTNSFTIISDGFDQAKNDGAWAIISPTTLAIIHNFDSNSLIKDTIVTPSSAIKFIGVYRGVDLYINQYCNDYAPIVFGQPGCFSYNGGEIKTGKHFDDENTSVFYDTFTYRFDRSKLLSINIDVEHLKLFCRHHIP
jgi:hypothetical protein